MSDGGGENHLTPKYTPCRPPWVGLFDKRQRKGRENWWTELNYEEDAVRKNKFRIFRPRFSEEDPDWWDPKVPDGKSISGPYGLDSSKHPNLTIKGDQVGSLKDFQEKVYKSSAQFKAIAEKWDLSPEHPGFDINPILNSAVYTPKHLLGFSGFTRWHQYGPRFFEKPLNEGTFMKGLACAKYAAIGMIPMTMMEIRSFGSVPVKKLNFKTYLKRYFQLSVIPLTLAFTWGTSLSIAAAIRNRDDTVNHLYSSAAVGATLGAIKNSSTIGFTAAILTLIAGVLWHYSRLGIFGLQGPVLHQYESNYWSGPLTWKLFSRGDAEVPSIQY